MFNDDEDRTIASVREMVQPLGAQRGADDRPRRWLRLRGARTLVRRSPGVDDPPPRPVAACVRVRRNAFLAATCPRRYFGPPAEDFPCANGVACGRIRSHHLGAVVIDPPRLGAYCFS